MQNSSSKHADLKGRTANLSVYSNTVITSLKIVAGLLTFSMSIISEAIHSAIDLVAAIIAKYAITQASKPPDADHKFGHGKAENLGSLAEAVIIFVASAIIIFVSIKKIISGSKIEHVGIGIWVMLFSALANLVVGLRVRKVAKITDSPALEADALHILTDVYCSAGVMLALAIIYFGRKWGLNLFIADPIIAIVIALYIAYLAFDLAGKATAVLADKRLSDREEKLIVSTIEEHYGSILGFHALRTRKAGFTKHIDLHLEVPKDMTVSKAHELCDKLEKDVKKHLPGTDIVIHIEPCKGNCKGCKYFDQNCQKG